MNPAPEPGSDELEPGASAAVARRLAPTLVDAGTEQPITVDQTNRSVFPRPDDPAPAGPTHRDPLDA